MKSFKAVIWGLLTLLLILFLFQNKEAFLSRTTLELNLFGPLQFRSVPIPLYALILAALFLGVLITAIYCGIGNYRLHQSVRSLKRQNESLREELKSLRNLPITEAEVSASAPVVETSGREAEEKEPADKA